MLLCRKGLGKGDMRYFNQLWHPGTITLTEEIVRRCKMSKSRDLFHSVQIYINHAQKDII